jgi:hypothetical protein
MTPEISEFSYGFALTNEIVGWAPLATAPIFPSLIEEGKDGGGYDVKLDFPGVALYLQFKRADCMVRKSVAEIKLHGLPLATPFYRLYITESGKSNQHEMLLGLDNGNNAVFYVAPRFHELTEINQAWNDNTVASRSIFIRPSEIGKLDSTSHHISYDPHRAYGCSDPSPVEFMNSDGVVAFLQNMLNTDGRPLRDKIPEFATDIEMAIQRATDAVAGPDSAAFIPTGPSEVPRLPLPQVPTRSVRPLGESSHALRQIADLAAKNCDLQLIIVQPLG